MIPRILCRSCGNEIESSDKFCSRCGAKVEWNLSPLAPVASSERTGSPSPKTSLNTCPLCGQQNPANASYCDSCGARLSSAITPAVEPIAKQRLQSEKTPNVQPLKFLQSWKVTAGFAIVLIVVLIVLKTNRENETKPITQNLSPNANEMVKQIESLQKVVDTNPKDQEATLRLANLFHDVKALPRAV